ncbi:uncharacterized protein HD556DRAFT_1491298, partial [Suillus plorans]
THPADCRVLFNESKKSRDPAISEPDPSGSQKNHIWAAIAEVIFEKDEEYKDAYAEDKHKFTVAVSNRITHLRNKYKKQHARFHQTGAGINPLDAAGAQNLREQVLIDFPWFDILDKLWKSNPVFALKTISSVPGVDHAANMAALTQGKGKQMVAQAPSPDPDNIVGDTESDIIDDILDEPLLAQGKSKEKALPPPCPDEPMDEDLNPNDDHTFITQPEPPLPSTPLNDADDDGEPRDNNFGPSNQEDEDTVQQRPSNKRPCPSSPPPTHALHTPNNHSRGKFQTHVDRVTNRGAIRSPKSSPSQMSSSSSATSSRIRATPTGISGSQTSSTRKAAPSQKSSLSKCVDSEMQDVQGQVESLTTGMSYIYTVKAAASEYKLAKVNAHRHQRDIEFQREQADKECSDAAIVHQRAQEAKALELQVLEAQARVQAEKRAALQLEIKLLKLRGGAS